MTNLLPPEELQNVRNFYRARFLTVGSFVATACALIALIALVPSFLIVWIDSSSQRVVPVVSANRELDQTEYRKTQDRIKQLALVVHATSSSMQIVMRAVNARPKGISIDRISYSTGKGGAPLVILAGVSARREAINAYYDTLKSDGTFKNVVIPVEDLVGTNGSRFTVTLTGK